jgi:heme/copper-type cytochrome/quinol oxidase subunit 3
MASMTMLFGASLVGYLVTRFQNPVWRAGMPGLPSGLWVSTGLLVIVSLAFSRAIAATRRNRFEALEGFLWLAGAAALGFLVMQAQNWHVMMRAEAAASARTLYAFTFFMLTGLHAAHVIGGFVPLAIVIRKTRLRQYSSSRLEGLVLCRRYWDYLGVVWLVLLAAMYVAT